MTITKSKNRKTTTEKLTVSIPELPSTYNKLLNEYIVLIEQEPVNPYRFSIKQRTLDYFNIKEQLNYAKSPHINDFIKIPDALSQELPAAKEIMKEIDKYDDQTIKTLADMNNINLARLRKRSIKNQIGPGVALLGSIIGLLIDLQDVLAVSLKNSLVWLERFNASLFFQWVIISIIFLAILAARINWMFITPRIGVVDAFGDILQIMKSHRNIK